MGRPAVEAPVAGERRLRMSYEEWLAWRDQEFKSEWVDGEVIVFRSATRRQGQISFFMAVLLSHFVTFRRLGVVLAGC